MVIICWQSTLKWNDYGILLVLCSDNIPLGDHYSTMPVITSISRSWISLSNIIYLISSTTSCQWSKNFVLSLFRSQWRILCVSQQQTSGKKCIHLEDPFLLFSEMIPLFLLRGRIANRFSLCFCLENYWYKKCSDSVETNKLRRKLYLMITIIVST